jgi:hypothetical protein
MVRQVEQVATEFAAQDWDAGLEMKAGWFWAAMSARPVEPEARHREASGKGLATELN